MNERYKIIQHFSKSFYLSEDDIKDFEREVNLAIEEGWKPTGGVFCTTGSQICLMQALIY